MKGSQLLGVLDLDSPVSSRFDDQDARGLENLVRILLSSVLSAPEERNVYSRE
jgi:GAF domain-containing protein